MQRIQRTTAIALTVVMLTAGCDDEEVEPFSEETSAEEPAAEEPTAEERPDAPGRFVVHEWGLIGAGRQGVHPMQAGPVPEGTFFAGIPLTDSGHGYGKPVLYIHLDPGAEPITLRAQVQVPEGSRVVEHFPPATLSDGDRTLVWPEVAVRTGACDDVAAYPTAESPNCRDVEDGYCEAAELAHYETEDGACLTIGAAQHDHLFYRATTTSALPISVAPSDEDGSYVLTASAQVPGSLIRVQRADAAAETRVSILEPPTPGTPLVLAPPTEHQAEAGARALRDGLEELGMTSDESAAFMRAWQADLFGASEGVEAPDTVGDPPPALRPRHDALLYWLPATAADEAATLTFSPRPRETRRAILIANDLAPEPATTEYGGLRGRAANVARIRTGAAEVEGGDLSREIIRRVIRRHINEVRFCYEQELNQAPDLEGRVSIAFTIDASGRVTASSVSTTTLSNERAETCMTRAVGRWTFPATEGRAPVQVVYPFVLQSSGG